MLNELELRNIAKAAAEKQLPRFSVSRIVAEPTLDSEGNEALRIVFVLPSEAVDAITGEDALKLLVDLHDVLIGKGDERFPIIEYTTEADFNEFDGEDDETDDEDEI
jgi:hypothetical protein